MLVGCNQADLLQKFASPSDQALAKSYINLLRQQRFEDIEKAADPSIRGASLHGTLVKMKGRKWPWVLFVIFGFGKFAVNWTTGQWAFAPMSFQLFSASAVAPLYGQWTLAVSVPLGAVIFLALRTRLSSPAITSSHAI